MFSERREFNFNVDLLLLNTFYYCDSVKICQNGASRLQLLNGVFLLLLFIDKVEVYRCSSMEN